MANDLEVVDNTEARRWEARLNGEVAGYSEYTTNPGRITFTHTVVDPAFEGRGIGSQLVKTALDDSLSRNLRIVPRCPFVRAYVTRHSKYSAHVDLPGARESG